VLALFALLLRGRLIGDRERAFADATRRLRDSRSSLTEAQRLAHLGNWDWNIEMGDLR
jgi:hypothetical protein